MSITLKKEGMSDQYNAYVVEKWDIARKSSQNVGETDQIKILLDEMEHFVILYNLESKLNGLDGMENATIREKLEAAQINKPETFALLKRCINIFHKKYGVDVKNGLSFIKAQWRVENGGTDESVEQHELQRLYSHVSQIMLVARTQRVVNKNSLFDDPETFWTLDWILRAWANPDVPGVTNDSMNALVATLNGKQPEDVASEVVSDVGAAQGVSVASATESTGSRQESEVSLQKPHRVSATMDDRGETYPQDPQTEAAMIADKTTSRNLDQGGSSQPGTVR